MAFWDKKSNEQNAEVGNIAIGQVSQIPLKDRDIFISTQRTFNLEEKIACEHNKFKAIDTIITETPDGKQAFNTYLRLANQGITIELFNRKTGKRVKKYDNEVRNFCSNMGVNNSSGLDGMIDQLHGCAVAHGGMACEVLVNEEATDVDDVILIDTATFAEYKWLENERRYAIYQNRDDGKKVDLYEGNFFYVPYQPFVGRPDGTLSFLPSIVTMTQFYQLWNDSARTMNRVANPRYNVTIDQEKLLNTLPANVKNNAVEQQKVFRSAFNDVTSSLRSIGKDSDIVHFDSNSIEIIGGGVNGAGIDVRAWFEVLEPLIVNSFNMTPVLMGRLNGGSYSLGTVEFKIVTDTVDSMRRGSKRIIEQIINLWARVKGYNVYAVVNHNPIDWEVMEQKLKVELMKYEKARRAEEYGWISHDTAAAEAVGAEKADNKNSEGIYEYAHYDLRKDETVTEKIETIEEGSEET